ncbi:MAG: hypothetical protein H6610_01680 [Ignavibacteriales bacterium]|nr:hypothetical protein [Ignavibacteriales bacterium]MCB9218152.1 hypothetical protein [Ignavibacteriales bacterium]
MLRIKISILILILFQTLLFGQGRLYEGPEDPAGDISEEREGYMNGNRVLLYFKNAGQIADIFRFGYNNPRDSKWPNNFSGTRMIDVGTLVVFSKVFVKNDSIPVTDLSEISSLRSQGQIDSMVFVQSGWIWNYDANYEGTIRWQFTPVKGYINPSQDYIAMSNKPDSWPIEGWPSRGFETKWPGEWNGRFGRGIQYADLESYFVFNDAQDLEKIVQRNDPEENLIVNGPRYHPRPGRFIGDINPDVTVQKGYPWGGLGLRVATRGFQWNNPEAKDIIFWEFDITNISDYDLPVSGFGYDIDMALGDEHSPDDDIGYFNKELDMVYVWDFDGIGVGGIIPGVFATAYLESPGLAYDNIDNDDDGLTDEKRDNQAGRIIGAYDNITNLSKFLDFYNLNEEDLKEHWEGDEDQDWSDGFDANGNGTYSYKNSEGLWVVEEGEFAGDDVGLDGVGPADINYNGPDEGECNHVPDFKEGEGCEPNFAVTDISESDMLGLTTFRLMSDIERSANNWFHADDESCYKFLNAHVFEEFTGGEPQRLGFAATSSTFPLYKGRTERISIALLHAYESLFEISSSGHPAKNLFLLKKTTQLIYEADYRFAQPPILPKLTATSTDGKVILTWDDASVKLTREPFLGNINDFEGYKLYRSTDKYFQDSEVITDNKGSKASKKPIFQCDKVDGIMGNADYGEVGGVEYYLGDDSGIRHYFIDDQVENGRTYYYALVAYDYGAPEIGDGLSPTENNITLELDSSEEIVRMGKNIAIVTPRQKAAGFEDPSITLDNTETIGNAKVQPIIFDYNEIKAGHKYKVKFSVDTLGYIKKNAKDRSKMDLVIVNNGMKVYDETEESRLIYSESPQIFPMQNILKRDDLTTLYLYGQTVAINTNFYRGEEIFSNSFDGIQLKMERMNGYFPYELSFRMSERGVNPEGSGWLVGDSEINIEPSFYEYYAFPYEYQIVFTNNTSAYTNRLNRKTGINNIEMSGSANYLFDKSFSFYVTNQTALALTGKLDTLEMVVEDLNGNGEYDMLEDKVLVGHVAIQTIGSQQLISWGGTVFGMDFRGVGSESELPKAGDIYKYDFSRPFTANDSITFTVNGAVNVDKNSLNADMDEIKVVPNPYVMTNSMEPAVANKFLNQRRRLMFTHIPSECDIRIYTSSGVLVDEIKVENEPSDGIVHWDLLSKEDLEIAAGMYIYHIKSKQTGKEKIGKFAVIK